MEFWSENDQINVEHLDSQKLTRHECILLTDLVENLYPFGEATDYAQNITTAGYIKLCILGLKAELYISKFNSKLVSRLGYGLFALGRKSLLFIVIRPQ